MRFKDIIRQTVAICPKCETFTVIKEVVPNFYCVHAQTIFGAMPVAKESEYHIEEIEKIKCKVIKL